MITHSEVVETNRMIDRLNLDVRTITMGISLIGCADSDITRFCQKIYEKIVTSAGSLVEAGEEISRRLGVPIVNKRVSVTPIAIASAGCFFEHDKDSEEEYCGRASEGLIKIAGTMDKAAAAIGVNFIGGFTALVHKGITKTDAALIRSIPEALTVTERVCSSVNIADTKSGINMDAVKLLGEIIVKMARLTKDRDSIACAKFVAFANAVEDNPFMAGAFHGVGGGDSVIHVGVSGPGVVKAALEGARGADFETLCETVKKAAFKITRLGQLVAREASAMLGAPFGIIDLSLAPTPAVGDSVADIIEEMGIAKVGAHGSTAALAILNDNVKKGGVMASANVGGLSGSFIPVSEDAGMIDAAAKGAVSLDKLEAMTSVCSVGLDMIAIPGDTPASTISGIIADEAAIGVVNGKTTAVRVIPAFGKSAGQFVEFGGLLGKAPVMTVNPHSCADFINRGGRVPAMIHSFRN